MDRDAKAGAHAPPPGALPKTADRSTASTPSAPVVAPGDVIGDKYRIEAVIGRGGMSVVYRARHLELEQEVAIKVLSPAALVLPEYVARLRREARAASRVRSQHVVRIYDIGELPKARVGERCESTADARDTRTETRERAGIPFLVMEYLTGADLAAVLAKRGPLPIDLATTCIMQACEALGEAHAAGIIHRDLKPANLFLTENVDGSPCIKVLDFGISRMTPRTSALGPLTDPGTVLGTPSYMAPEQMEAAEALDARSDIWALGAILYELLVGTPPYSGDSLPQIFMKIVRAKRPPKPSASRRDVPPALDDVVAGCLAADPDHRFADVAELAWALSKVMSPHGRESAERVSRVLERKRAEAASRSHATSTRPVAVRVGTTTTRRRAPVQAGFALAASIVAGALVGLGAARVEFDGMSVRAHAGTQTAAADRRASALVDDAFADDALLGETPNAPASGAPASRSSPPPGATEAIAVPSAPAGPPTKLAPTSSPRGRARLPGDDIPVDGGAPPPQRDDDGDADRDGPDAATFAIAPLATAVRPSLAAPPAFAPRASGPDDELVPARSD